MSTYLKAKLHTGTALPFITAVFLGQVAVAEIPDSIPHQGRIAVSGINFDGTGQFKFLLFADPDANHASGNEIAVWSNAATAPAGIAEPATAVQIAVSKGLYGTWLGDTSIANMAALPASVEPPAGAGLYLRVWFNDGVAGFQPLAPDQTISAVPFALHAAGVTDGGVTASALADGAVTGAKLADGAVTSAKLGAGAVDSSALVDGAVTSGKIAEGAVTELGIPDTDGSLSHNPLIAFRDFTNLGIGGFLCMAVDNDFVYQASNTGRLIIFDVSDPANIVQRGFITGGLGNITSIVVKDGIAYLLDDSPNNRVILMDVSDPDNITQISTIETGMFSIGSTNKIALSGQTIYAIGRINGTVVIGGLLFTTIGRLQAIDVSNPAVPVLSGAISTNLVRPSELAISGSTAVVVDNVLDHIALFDISNPANIAAKDTDNTVVVGESRDLAVRGSIGYYLDSDAGSMQIFDFSDTDNIVARSSLLTSGTSLSIAITGNLAIITDTASIFLRVIDISDPDNPVRYDNYPSVFSGCFLVSFLGNRMMVTGANGRLETLEIIPALSASGGLNVTGEMNVSALARFREIRVSTRISADNRLEARELIVSGTASTASLSNTTATSLAVSGPLTGTTGAFSGTVGASDFNFPTPKAFALSIPGNALLEQNPGEGFFRSTQGYVQLQSGGSDTGYLGLAEVHLPQGATIVGMDLLYFDNSATNSFTNITARFRRLPFITSSVGEQNIFAIDNMSPSSPNNTSIILLTDDTPEAGRNIVDNMNNTYFVSVNFTVNAADSQLRFYGFRIRYTLSTLAP